MVPTPGDLVLREQIHQTMENAIEVLQPESTLDLVSLDRTFFYMQMMYLLVLLTAIYCQDCDIRRLMSGYGSLREMAAMKTVCGMVKWTCISAQCDQWLKIFMFSHCFLTVLWDWPVQITPFFQPQSPHNVLLPVSKSVFPGEVAPEGQ